MWLMGHPCIACSGSCTVQALIFPPWCYLPPAGDLALPGVIGGFTSGKGCRTSRKPKSILFFLLRPFVLLGFPSADFVTCPLGGILAEQTLGRLRATETYMFFAREKYPLFQPQPRMRFTIPSNKALRNFCPKAKPNDFQKRYITCQVLS